MPHDRELAPSPYPGDDGQAPAALRELLERASRGDQVSYLRAVAGLGAARLLVPVVAEVTRTGTTGHGSGGHGSRGLRVDKEADMSVVLLQTADGRRCGLAFTGLDALASWHPQARPVPVTIDVVARAALDDRADALIIDTAGPAALVLERQLLDAFADGRRLVELDDGGFGWLSVAAGT